MSKEDRIRAGQEAAIARVGKRAISLTVALLRVKVLRESLQPALDRLAATGRSDADLRAEAADQALRIEPTDAARVDSLYSVYLGVLYAVVEKWQAWDFSDPSVDSKVDDDRVASLKKHRNAIFHADHYDHKAITTLAERENVIEWADKLYATLEAFFREWHKNPEQHVKTHLQRTGL